MAKETIAQVLSPTNATYINGVSARRLLVDATLKNLYQGLIETSGRGINDRFITSDEANTSAQVFVNRVLPINPKARELGASKNGASFANDYNNPQTTTVGIKVLTVFDEPIIVARNSQDRIAVDLVSEIIDNWSKGINTAVNGGTFATKLLAYLNAGNDGNGVEISSSDISNKLVLNRFVEANALLDAGDLENGVDAFPTEDRIAVVKASFRPTLLNAGILALGGANFGYDIVKGGALDAQSTTRKLENGFIGVIDNVPVHIISGLSLRYASTFLGLPANELLNADIYGHLSSGYGTARGVAMVEEFKIVDARGGQGIEIQPLVKFGCETWYPKSVVALKGANFLNYADAIDTKWSGVDMIVKGAGSRLYPEIEINTASTTKVKATYHAYGEAGSTGTDYVKATAYYVVSDEPITTFAGFVSAYGANDAIAGTLSSNTEASFSATQTAGDYVNVCACSTDGSITIVSKKIA